MNEIDYESDSFGDIVAKDPRYNARAYSLLVDVITRLGSDESDNGDDDAADNDGESEGRHMCAADILEEFKLTALDQFGPLAYTVLTEWGVTCTEDIGEMMFNLVDSKRIGRDEGDNAEDFVCAYDFRDEFLGPFEA